MGTETGTQKTGTSTKWVFTLPTNIANLRTLQLKLPHIWKRIWMVYPEKFLPSCCCHFLFNFIFCLSSHIRNPLALFRLICHRVVGLIFFPLPLTVSDFSFNQSIRVNDVLFHLLQASPQYLYVPFCSLIQSPHLRSQSQGWKPMAPPVRHWAWVIKQSHIWLCVTFSTNALRPKCWYFPLNIRCCFFFLLCYPEITLLPWTLWWQNVCHRRQSSEFCNLTSNEGRIW